MSKSRNRAISVTALLTLALVLCLLALRELKGTGFREQSGLLKWREAGEEDLFGG